LSLLTIFESVIRAKAEYGGTFFFSSASMMHQKKFNAVLASCLRFIVGAIRSTPLISLEVECGCPPMAIRSRWLVGKFLLKALSNPYSEIFKRFYDLSISWR